ncbi:hypothetical protein TWF694_004364 [Orbilia ellipsospora]|uniref:DUF6923 domain-containing protein n=1 Tax=Orbilia ellipsospora TaxID=2528407 RepID=A0AAV9WY69_9PEZI
MLSLFTTIFDGTVTVVITEPIVTVTTSGPVAGTTTEIPPIGSGSTITVVITTTTPFVWSGHLDTVTLGATKEYITTIFPATATDGSIVNDPNLTATVAHGIPNPQGTPNGPAFGCDPAGFGIYVTDLYRIDITNGATTLTFSNMDGGTYLNALAYNSMDNYLYAIESGTNRIMRITASGNIVAVGTVTQAGNYVVGDIDRDGQYYISTTGSDGKYTWVQINLSVFSGPYATQLRYSQITNGGYNIYDWTLVPEVPAVAWSIVVASDGNLQLVRFDFNSNTVSVPGHYNLGGAGCGAMFADVNGDIYCTGNTDGTLLKVNIGTPNTIGLVSHTPYGGTNSDGARCVFSRWNLGNG